MLAREKISIENTYEYLLNKLKESGYITGNPESDAVELSPPTRSWFILKIKHPSQRVFSSIGYAVTNKINGVALGLLDSKNNDVGGEDYEEVKYYLKDSYVVYPALEYVWRETIRLCNLATTKETLTPLSAESKMAAHAAAAGDPTLVTATNSLILSSENEARLKKLKQQLSIARLEAAVNGIAQKEATTIKIKHTPDFSGISAADKIAMVNAFNKIYHKLFELDSRVLGLFSLRCCRSYYPSHFNYRDFPDLYLKDVAKHAYRMPNSRTARAYALAMKHFSNTDLNPRSDNFNIVLFHDLRAEDVSRHWFKRTWLNGFHLFKSAIIYSGYNASKQEIAQAAQNKGRRTGIICDTPTPVPRRAR